MRKLIFIILITVILSAAVMVAAQEIDDWGYRLEGSDIDLIIPLTDDFSITEQMSITTPAWSPDGEWIAFTGSLVNKLWIIPAEGGEATVIYEYNQFPELIEAPGCYIITPCFTSDSQEVTFVKSFYDEDRGSKIEFREDGYSFSNPLRYIESVNIYTGEHRFLAEGENPKWSHNGRYLYYKNWDWRIRVDGLEPDHHGSPTILDTKTGEKWFLTDDKVAPGLWSCRAVFTPDDSHIIVTMEIGELLTDDNGYEYYEIQLFSIPVNGGEPEQITFYNGDYVGERRYDIDLSPDGVWILYYDPNLRIRSYEEGSKSGSYSAPLKTFCAYNMITGESFEIFPRDEKISACWPSFSPDGKKICYIRRDKRETGNRTLELWIKDFNIDSLQKIDQEIVLVEEQPERFTLLSNYPNPFNISTTIEFTLPEAGFTELIIYNIMGQKVRELMAQDMPAGVHSVVWNGRDENGIPVSSGVFVSRLTSGENVVSNRMMLVK